MANVISGSAPIRCDTAATLRGDGMPVRLLAIAWESDSASQIAGDDDILLSDADGNEIFGKRAAFAGDGVPMYHFPENYRTNGLVMTTIDGGVCYVYI